VALRIVILKAEAEVEAEAEAEAEVKAEVEVKQKIFILKNLRSLGSAALLTKNLCNLWCNKLRNSKQSTNFTYT